jgi:hypothetical protein
MVMDKEKRLVFSDMGIYRPHPYSAIAITSSEIYKRSGSKRFGSTDALDISFNTLLSFSLFQTILRHASLYMIYVVTKSSNVLSTKTT